MSLLQVFRKIAVLEGVSYLLFAITMPLKYLLEIPEPNFVVGIIHGLLFITYCGIGLWCAIKYKWSFGFSTWVFFASLIPFGTFYLERKHLSSLNEL